MAAKYGDAAFTAAEEVSAADDVTETVEEAFSADKVAEDAVEGIEELASAADVSAEPAEAADRIISDGTIERIFSERAAEKAAAKAAEAIETAEAEAAEAAEGLKEAAAEAVEEAEAEVTEAAEAIETGAENVAETAEAEITEAAEGLKEAAAEAVEEAEAEVTEAAEAFETEAENVAEAAEAEITGSAEGLEEAAAEALSEETADTAPAEAAAPIAAAATSAGRAEKNAKKKKRMHPLLKVLIGLLIIVVLGAAAVGIATYTKYITWFEDGPMISNKEDLTMQLDAENLEKLNNFKNLKHVDLTGSPAGFEAVKAWADAHPNVDVDYMVDIPENASFDVSTGLVDFTKLDAASAIANIEGVQELLKGKSVKIDPDTWTADDIEAFTKKLTRFELVNAKKTFKNADVDTIRRYMAAVPDFEFDGTVALDNIEASITETTMDFTELSDDGLKVLDEFLNVLPVYTDIELGSEFAHDRLPTIYDFYKDHLDITVHYEFGVMGQRHDINDTILDFNHIYMHDQGAEVREVIACMPHLRILDMDWCLVDNAHMEAIRNDFPNVDVEWRLWFPSNDFYSVRTDAEKIFLSQFGNGMLTNSDCEQLKYCTKVKYMDIGHNEPLSDASFLAYMPELEVLVLSINLIDDISGLANCPHLEYFEMFNTHITNLDALANCKELKHLNVCQNPYLTDISGVYGVDGIERFWIGDAWSTSVPREQVEKYKELHPETLTCDYTYGAHTAGWRTGERYALLWKQMGYDEEESDYSFYWKDPENPRHPWWTKYSEENGYTAENGYWNKYPVLQTGMWF